MAITEDVRTQIIALLREGALENEEIATKVGVSPGTVAAVKAHLTMGSYARQPAAVDASETQSTATPVALGPADDLSRIKLFFWIQVFFLPVSALAGGFHFKVWSMLDTALLIQSVGLTGLAAVLESGRLRRIVFAVAVALYVAAVIDMGINVVASGVLGWQKMPS